MSRFREVVATILAVSLLVSAGPALAASEVDALLNKLMEKGVLSAEEAQEVRNDIAKESAPAAKAREGEIKDVAKKMAGGEWLSTVKWGGDFRVRHEIQKREPATDRNRQRFRLRLGFTAKPIDLLEIGARLASGASGDPTSTNQSFSSTFDKKPLFIDLAYVKYKAMDWLSLVGGKMKNPFFTVKEGMVWDGDVTPEGAAVELKSSKPVPGLDQLLVVKPFANAGMFAVSELSGDFGDQGLFGLQAGANVDLPLGMKLTTAGAYYEMTGIEGKRTVDITAAPAGNSTRNAAAIFAYDYDMVTFTNQLALPKIFNQPVSLRGDYVHNTGASDDNGGWLTGLEVGEVTEKFGSWKAGYAYKRLEPDATFGAIADSDFGTGGTNHKGHIMGVSMGINKYTSVGLKYFRTDEIEGSQAHNDTLQADLQMKF